MAITILTAVLVTITAFYAWQTKRMVNEMARARGASLYPRLVPTINLLGGGNGFPRVINVGAGPAIDVELQISLEPDGPSQRWRRPVLVQGEFHDFMLGGRDAIHRMDDLVSNFASLRIKGSYKDALRLTHEIDEAAELRETWDLIKAATEIAPQDPLKDIKRELEKISKAVSDIAGR